MSSAEHEVPEDLPPPTPAMEMMRFLVEAYVGTAPPKQAAAFVRALAEIVRNDQECPPPVRMSPRGMEAARSHRQAISVLRRELPGYLSRLDDI